jgi:hypothetical protein
MALYEADGSNKQKPNTTAKGYKQLAGYSTTPAENTLQKSPTYVIVNEPGTYAFSYPDHTTGTTTSSYITGSKVGLDGDVYSPLKLDINPVKWRQTDAAGSAGDVIFVYRRMG